jgi:hypothetical protein
MSIMPVVVALLLAQSQPAPQKKADSNEPVTLKGCVVRDTSSGSSYTFTDNTGSKYRLAGKSVAKYSGMSVEVVGLIDKPNLSVKGGLWPSPNVAAQAGNIDPGVAAVAALGGGTAGTGRVELPTLRITRVGLGTSECKQ